MEKSEVKGLSEIRPEWGQAPEDHFGYSTDSERLGKRGLEDWELVEKITTWQRRGPCCWWRWGSASRSGDSDPGSRFHGSTGDSSRPSSTWRSPGRSSTSW